MVAASPSPSSRAKPRDLFLSTQQQKQVPPLRLAARGSGRDDGSWEIPIGGDFQPPHHALCRKYRECRKIDFLPAVPSVDVELQPFLVDHALPQRDLAGDELLGLGR